MSSDNHGNDDGDDDDDNSDDDDVYELMMIMITIVIVMAKTSGNVSHSKSKPTNSVRRQTLDVPTFPLPALI